MDSHDFQEMAARKLNGSPFYGVVIAQVIATFLASAFCLAFDRVAAVSALAAGLVSIVPGLFMLVMSVRWVELADTGLGMAVKAETGRLILTGCLSALVFVFVWPLNAVAFFATFIVLQVCVAIAPWLEARRLLRHGK